MLSPTELIGKRAWNGNVTPEDAATPGEGCCIDDCAAVMRNPRTRPTGFQHFSPDLAMVLVLFTTLLVLVPVAWGSNQSSSLTGYGSNWREFDYFILSLEWPGSFCQHTRHCCAENACCHQLAGWSHFTIHGLWPEYNDGSWPQCCNGPSFDEEKISRLLRVLENDWPSLSCSSPKNCHGRRDSLWAHEWEKHGTCAYPVIQNEYSYFSTALQLHSKYNILGILEAAGYPPGNNDEYPTHDLVAAITAGVGATPSLVCSHGQLKEVRLCFDKDLKPKDCTTGHEDQSNLHWWISCPRYIIIPQYASPGRVATKNVESSSFLASVALENRRPFI